MMQSYYDDGVFPCNKCRRKRKCTKLSSMERCPAFVEYRAKHGTDFIDISEPPCNKCTRLDCKQFRNCAQYLMWYRAKMEDLRLNPAPRTTLPAPVRQDPHSYEEHLHWMLLHSTSGTWKENEHEHDKKAGA